MGDTKIKTKAAMLNELESIKGLLLEEDDIPILQEVIEHKTSSHTSEQKETQEREAEEKATSKTTTESRTIREEQQDFFNSPLYTPPHADISAADLMEMYPLDSANDLLETLSYLEKHTEEVTASKLPDKPGFSRPSLAKATGENPFLPEHIRARLHGNNPPPLFANETARKISNSSLPSRQLGNTFSFGATSGATKANNYQQDIIDSIIEKMMPDIERELRNRLETLSKNMLDELNK
jgi:hypothetical protein